MPNAEMNIHLDGEAEAGRSNLGNARNPVAESEFGEGSYYRLPARTVLVNLSYDLR